ncbi:MAG TPA: hypothetical protein VFF04_07085 [Candidatus Babeliales bacterium]|nr:hypothetical protein [Candidatus Babeliales bacterium]
MIWGLASSGFGLLVALLGFFGGGCTKKVHKSPILKQEERSPFNEPTLEELRKSVVVNIPVVAHNDAQTSIDAQSHKVRAVSEEQMFQQEAKCSDVPVPMGAQIVKELNHQEQESIALYCTCAGTSSQDIRSFYEREMERLGWQQVAAIEGSELLLTFQKPTRFCTVLLKPIKGKRGKKAVDISLYTGTMLT